MELFCVIGNLGSNAEYKNENGNEYIKFNVAETRRWVDASNQQHEETIWNSCIMHGKNEKLMPYLTKGSKVFVMGRGSTRIYSSPKEKRMVAGINISVDRIELIQVNSDPVGKQIVSADGQLFNVSKLYYVGYEQARAAGATMAAQAQFYDLNGNAAYLVDYNGFVTRVLPTDQQAQQQTQPATTEPASEPTAEPASEPASKPASEPADQPFTGGENPAMAGIKSEKSKKNKKE